jgi:hypothetical protein
MEPQYFLHTFVLPGANPYSGSIWAFRAAERALIVGAAAFPDFGIRWAPNYLTPDVVNAAGEPITSDAVQPGGFAGLAMPARLMAPGRRVLFACGAPMKSITVMTNNELRPEVTLSVYESQQVAVLFQGNVLCANAPAGSNYYRVTGADIATAYPVNSFFNVEDLPSGVRFEKFNPGPNDQLVPL